MTEQDKKVIESYGQEFSIEEYIAKKKPSEMIAFFNKLCEEKEDDNR